MSADSAKHENGRIHARLVELETQLIEQDHRVVPVLARFIAEFVAPRSWWELLAYAIRLPKQFFRFLTQVGRSEAIIESDEERSRRRIAVATAAARLLVGPTFTLAIGAGLTTAVAAAGVVVALRQQKALELQNQLVAKQTRLATFEQTSHLRSMFFRPPSAADGSAIQHYYQNVDAIGRWPAPNPSEAEQVAQFASDAPEAISALRPLLFDDAGSVASASLLALSLVHARQPRLGALDATRARLSSTTLDSIQLDGVDLRGANLTKASVRNSSLVGVVLNEAKLEDARFAASLLMDADLSGVQAARAVLEDVDLRGAVVDDADLRNTDLRRTRLDGASMARADLRGVRNMGGEYRDSGAHFEMAPVAAPVAARLAKVWVSSLGAGATRTDGQWTHSVFSDEALNQMCVYGVGLLSEPPNKNRHSNHSSELEAIRGIARKLNRVQPAGCPFDSSRDLGVSIHHVGFDSAKIDDAAIDVRLIAAILDDNPYVHVRLVGHTTAEGEAEYNMVSGGKIADNAKAYLTSQGLDEERIQTTSRGELDTLAMDGFTGSEEENRRLEIEFWHDPAEPAGRRVAPYGIQPPAVKGQARNPRWPRLALDSATPALRSGWPFEEFEERDESFDKDDEATDETKDDDPLTAE